MKRQWWALLVTILAVAAVLFAVSRACNDDGGDGGPTPSGQSPSPTPEIISEATRVKDGLELTIKIDDETYELGEDVPVQAVVKNTRSDDVTYAAVVPGQPAYRLDVISLSPLGGASLDPGEDGPPAEGTLEAGDELDIEAEWDQQLDIDQDPIQAPPGRYSVQATFIASVAGNPEPVSLQAAVTFRLEGSEPVLLPVEVLGVAIKTDELKAWLDGRAENVICAYPPTGLFYQAFAPSGTAAETFDFLYEGQRDSGSPICGIGTDGGAWRLNFYSQKGDLPNRFNMLFDLNDGTLLGTEEPTTPPSPSP